MKRIYHIIGLVALGIVMAAFVDQVHETSKWLGRQLVFIVTLGIGLAVTDRLAGMYSDLRKCMLALLVYPFVFVALLVVVFLADAFMIIVMGKSIELGPWVGERALIGWYPRGPDAWFPIAMLIWCVSAISELILAIIVGRLVRILLSHRANIGTPAE